MNFFIFGRKEVIESHLQIKEHNFLFLLISLLLLLCFWPLLKKFNLGQYFFTALIFVAFFSSTRILIRKNLFFFIIAFSFVFFTITIKLLNVFHHELASILVYCSIVLGILCSFFIAAIVLIHILKNKKITLNEVYGSICVYILIGMSWALMYFLAAEIDPSSISPSPDPADPMAIIPRYLYYSFITLTSSGTPDVNSGNFLAMLLVIGEVIIGQIYPLILISWLVQHLTNLRK